MTCAGLVVYTTASSEWRFSSERLSKLAQAFRHLFELLAHPRPSGSAGVLDDATAPNLRQLGQELARPAGEPGIAAAAPPQQTLQQVTGDTHESVHVQFLIRPVKLGMGSQHAGILQVAKRRFYLGLPAIGFDDLRRGPFVSIRDQDAQAKIARPESGVFV